MFETNNINSVECMINSPDTDVAVLGTVLLCGIGVIYLRSCIFSWNSDTTSSSSFLWFQNSKAQLQREIKFAAMQLDDCEKAVCVMYGFLNENKFNKVCHIMFGANTSDPSLLYRHVMMY